MDQGSCGESWGWRNQWGGPRDPLCSVDFGGVCGSECHVDMCWAELLEEVRPGVTPTAMHAGTDLEEWGGGR